MKQDLSILREEMKQDSKDLNKIEQSMKNVAQNWEDRHDTLAYYLEHDELEKVETHLTILQSDIELKEYHQGVEELDACSFVLEHIQDKESFRLKNIF